VRESEPSLEPDVEAAACVVCGAAERTLLTSAAELEADAGWLRAFHRRRVRAPRDDALAERAEFTQDYATDVVTCATCGLVFRDPRPPARAIRAAYAEDTYGTERLRELHAAQRELFRPKAARLRRRLAGRRAPVVIEIGSFVGGFLAAAREQGFEAFGIDPGEEVSAFCASLGLPVLRESVEACDFPPGGADCVAVWSTFDQLPDPHPPLAAARRWLRPGGLLALRCPNGACYARASAWLRRWPRPFSGVLRAGLAWNNLLGFPYLFGYSVPTLDRLLARHGLERVDFAGDVLVRLADAQTKPWAAWEERALKALWRAAAALDPAGRPRGAALAPWFDVIYHLAGP
jgi:SAM-dependent methyltransferase